MLILFRYHAYINRFCTHGGFENVENRQIFPLLRSFFEYYRDFPYHQRVVSVRTGNGSVSVTASHLSCLADPLAHTDDKKVDPNTAPKRGGLLLIEDPFELSHNIAGSVKQASFHNHCSAAVDNLRAWTDVMAILVPPSLMDTFVSKVVIEFSSSLPLPAATQATPICSAGMPSETSLASFLALAQSQVLLQAPYFLLFYIATCVLTFKLRQRLWLSVTPLLLAEPSLLQNATPGSV